MDSTTASGRKVRASRRLLSYKGPSSSSDGPIKSPQPSPSRVAKCKREDSLPKFKAENPQTQDPSNSGDAPFAPYHPHTGSHLRKDPSRESEDRIGSDIPIVAHRDGQKHKFRELSDHSSCSSASDVPIFPYLRQKRLNAVGAIAQPSSPPPKALHVPGLKDRPLTFSNTEAFHENEDPKLDTFVSSQLKVHEGPVESSAPVYVGSFDPQFRSQQFSKPGLGNFCSRVTLPTLPSVIASPLARVTTPKRFGSLSVNSTQNGDMAPTVSGTLNICNNPQLICICSIRTETETGVKIVQATSIMIFLRVSLFDTGAATMLL
jgi:hypothetical protein